MGKKVKYVGILLSYVLTVCLIVGLFPATIFAKNSTQMTEATKQTKKIVEITEATKPQKQKTMQVTDVETQETEIVDIEEKPEKENLPTTQITPTINNLIENSEQNDTTQNAENCDGNHTGWIELANKNDTGNAGTIIVSNTLTTGNYYLGSNVTITETLQIGGDVVLCLDGKSLTLSENKSYNAFSVIQVKQGAKLTLCDCKGNTGIITGEDGKVNAVGVYVDTAIFIMNGGTITKNINNTSNYGGGVYVNNGTFTMNGGSISNNLSYDGGGVYIDGSSTFTMNNNSIITDNRAQRDGGGDMLIMAHLL